MNKQLTLTKDLNATKIWACVVVVECTTLARKALFKNLRASATLKNYLAHPIEQGHHHKSQRYYAQFTETVGKGSQPSVHNAEGDEEGGLMSKRACKQMGIEAEHFHKTITTAFS